MKGLDGVLFDGFCFRESLAIVEVNEVGGSVVLASLSAFWAVPSEVSYLSALEAGVRLISCGSRVALEVSLRAVSLVAVRILSSAEVVAPVVSPIVSSRRCPVPVYVHRNWGVIHPSRGVR